MAERVYVRDVNNKLMSHLQKHDDKLDQKLHNHQVVLFGDRGDDGLVKAISERDRRIENIERLGDEVRNFRWTILAALVIEIAFVVFKII